MYLQASKGHTDVMELLLSAGAMPNIRDMTGATPLHRATSVGKVHAVRILVEKAKAPLEVGDGEGQTPLFVAVACKNSTCAVFLAAKGANIHVSNIIALTKHQG